MMRPPKIDQPTAAPTRKVTAATLAAAAGASLANLAVKFSAESPWLGWLSEPDVQVLVYALGVGLVTGLAGYVTRDRANV